MFKYLEGFNHGAGATPGAIDHAEKQLGLKLPAEYVEFLKVANGGEGFFGEGAYAILWSAEELARMNEAYQVQSFVPGFLLFGSDGGGEAFGFDTRNPDWPIVQVPFIPMEWRYAQPLGNSFSEFIKRLYEKRYE